MILVTCVKCFTVSSKKLPGMGAPLIMPNMLKLNKKPSEKPESSAENAADPESEVCDWCAPTKLTRDLIDWFSNVKYTKSQNEKLGLFNSV